MSPGRTPEEREAARLDREARRAAREGRPAPQPEHAAPPPRVEPLRDASRAPTPEPSGEASRAPVPQPTRVQPQRGRVPAAAAPPPHVEPPRDASRAPAPVPPPAAAQADGLAEPPLAAYGQQRRDWLAEAQRLTHAGGAGGAGGTGGAGRWRGGRGRRGPGRLIALGALGAILLGIGWFVVSLFQPFKGEGDGESVRVTIPQGAGLAQIADRLEESGVIEDGGFFQLRARLTGHSDDLRPGSYDLRKDMSFAAALDALQVGVPPNVVQVSIPEGLSRKEIAPLTEGLRGKYVRASRRSPALNPRDYGAERATSLEGFLFPATYELKKGQRVKRLVEQQLEHFKSNFDTVDLRYAKSKKLTAYDVLIIASLIEREAMVAKERPIIASVIYNRLRDDIRLDIDATTRFAVGNWRRPLRVSELQNQSPYNTRVHPGLPPGPIGNPGLDSIKAAARPAKTGFIFYVVKPKTCGEHNFAKTDAEFQRYVAEYNRARDANGGKSPTTC